MPGIWSDTSKRLVEPLEARRLLSSVSLIKPSNSYSPYDEVVAANGHTFFSFSDHLWVIDIPGGKPRDLGSRGNGSLNLTGIYLFDGDHPFASEHVFNTTTTEQVEIDLPIPGLNVDDVLAVGDKLIVSASDPQSFSGHHIFQQNAPGEAFTEVPHNNDFSSIDIPSQVFAYKGRPLFLSGGNLLRIDTQGNGDPVAVLVSHPDYQDPTQFREIAGYLYVYDNTGWWRTNGTSKGISYPYNGDPVEFKQTGWFADSGSLYRVDPATGDGIAAGDYDGAGPAKATPAGGRLFIQSFVTPGVWVSDGTADGTHAIGALAGVSVSGIFPFGPGRAIVSGSDSTYGTEFWVTDGTNAGTTLFDLNPGSANSDLGFSLASAGNSAYFFASTDAGDGLFRLDYGSGNHAPNPVIRGALRVGEGTSLKLDASGSSDPDGDRLLFRWDLNGDGDFSDLVTYDATTSVSWNRLNELGIKDGPATFSAKLKVSDASTTKTSTAQSLEVSDSAPRLKVDLPRQILAGSDWRTLFKLVDSGGDDTSRFTIDWGDGQTTSKRGDHATLTHSYTKTGVFSIRATATDEEGVHNAAPLSVAVVSALTGPTQLTDRANDTEQFLELNGKIIFSGENNFGGHGLWVTDGTQYGAVNLRPDLYVYSMLRAGDLIYFAAETTAVGGTGMLWRTDGTAKGTFQLATTANINFDSWFVYLNRVYFTTTDAGSNANFKLRMTDGTVAGTREVPGAYSAYPSFLQDPTPFGRGVYFIGDRSDGAEGKSLWLLDNHGKQLLEVYKLFKGSGEAHLHVTGLRLFIERTDFGSDVPADGAVWRSDGSLAGTRVVRAAASGDVFYTRSFAGSTTFLSTAPVDKDHPDNLELWTVSDDGRARLLKETRPGDEGSDIEFLANAGPFTYFTANDGTNGAELWRTDGTPGGTIPLGDIAPGEGSTTIGKTVAIGDVLYFTVHPGGIQDPTSILFRTDGSAAGTVRLTPAGDTIGVQESTLIAVGDRVNFLYRSFSKDPWRWYCASATSTRARAMASLIAPAGSLSDSVAVCFDDQVYLTSGVSNGPNDIWRIYSNS